MLLIAIELLLVFKIPNIDPVNVGESDKTLFPVPVFAIVIKSFDAFV